MNERDVLVAFHDDGMVLLDAATGRIFSVNRSGRMVWEQLQDMSPSDVANVVATKCGIPVATAEEHIQGFLASLAAWKLCHPAVES
jgi:hypothetical protein